MCKSMKEAKTFTEVEQEDAEDVNAHRQEEEVVTEDETKPLPTLHSIVKMKLSTFCTSRPLQLAIDALVIRMNRLMGEAYAFSNFHVLRIFESSGPLPKMDRNFFYRCLVAVGKSNARKDTLPSDMQASVAAFDELREAGNQEKVDIRGYVQIVADLSIIMATMASNHLWMNLEKRLKRYMRWKHNNVKKLHNRIISALVKTPKMEADRAFKGSGENEGVARKILEELKVSLQLPSAMQCSSRAHLTLPLYRALLIESEDAAAVAKSAGTVFKGRTFTLLPMKGGYTISHVPVSSMILIKLLQDTKLEKIQGDGRTEDFHALWGKYFNLKAIETRDRRFDCRIITDGYAVSVQMAKQSCTRCAVGEGCCMDRSTCRLVLSEPENSRAVGVDPGFTDVVTVAEAGKQVKSFSSARYYEIAKFNRSARATGSWNAQTESLTHNMPRSDTGNIDKFRDFVKAYLAVLPKLLAHRARKGYRNMRFTRFINRTKAINTICDFVAPRDGKFTVVMFGDWNGGSGSPVSRRTCGPLQEIKFKLREAHHVDLRSVDEFKTSKTCHICNSVLVNSNASATRYNHKENKWNVKKERIHKVLHCSSSAKNMGSSPCCGTTWNRDVNASKNILQLGVFDVFDIARPPAFCRTKQSSSRGNAVKLLEGETRKVMSLLYLMPPAQPAIARGIQSTKDLTEYGSNPYNDLVYNLVA